MPVLPHLTSVRRDYTSQVRSDREGKLHFHLPIEVGKSLDQEPLPPDKQTFHYIYDILVVGRLEILVAIVLPKVSSSP